MVELAWALGIGFLIGAAAVWIAHRLNDRYTKREKNISRLLMKRAKKE